MNSLILNPGSKTIKFEVFDYKLNSLLAGTIDDENGMLFLRQKTEGQKSEYGNIEQLPGSMTALTKILAITSKFAINKIGIRIVHGGEKFIEPCELNSLNLDELETLNSLAPLHNPQAVDLIKEITAKLPAIPIIGVFDTAFHQTILPTQYLYGLPYEYYQQYGIRKFGFHGISHKYVNSVFRTLEPQSSRVVSCHLGSGSSVTAVLEGKSFDTSMGFTPLDGLIMTTRAGDVDYGALQFIKTKLQIDDSELMQILNNKSGLLGISGLSFDMRVLLAESANGNPKAKLAIEMYVYSVVRYIGSYIAALNGIDGLIFTAGIGAGSDFIRQQICTNLSFAGFEIDPELNNGKINVESNLKISGLASKPIWIIPTDEEYQIAKEIC